MLLHDILRFNKRRLGGARALTTQDGLFVEEIPKNVSGKVLKRILRDRYG